MSPGFSSGIFLQITRIQHFLHVDDLGLGPFVRHAPEEKDLRVLGGIRETSGNRNRLRKCDVAAPVKLSWFSDLSAHNVIGLLEIPGIDGNYRIVKNLGVSLLDGLGKFREGFFLRHKDLQHRAA